VFLVLVVGEETLSMVRFLGSGGSHDTRATVSLFPSMSVLLPMTSHGDCCAFWELGILIGRYNLLILSTREGPAFGRGRPEQGAWQLWRCKSKLDLKRGAFGRREPSLVRNSFFHTNRDFALGFK